MRTIIFNLAISLDGFIEDSKGGFDWCFADQDYGMTDFLTEVDAIIFGRKSFEVMLQFEAKPYPGKQKYIASGTLDNVPKECVLWKDNFIEKVRELKQQPGKNIWLFGGASLAAQLFEAGLLDELQLSVHPVLLGSGKPIFENQKDRIKLDLIKTLPYSTGLVQLHYKIAYN